MKVYITKDSSGLIQLWKIQPDKFISKQGDFIWGNSKHKEIGIEVNSIFCDYMKDKIFAEFDLILLKFQTIDEKV